jgi:hypothetical protein
MAVTNLNGNTDLVAGSFPPVRVASTGAPLNPATGGLLTVDGITLIAGDRVLCKDEASAVNNGIYAANTGPWVRTSDAGTNNQFFSGMAVTVGLGAINAGQTFLCTCTDNPVVIGTSLITFASQQSVQAATQTATSTTSLAIGTGSKTFAMPAGKAFQIGQWVLAQETSNNANQMYGQVTSYSGTSLVLDVLYTGGSGTHADWTVVLSSSAAAAGYQPPVGTGNVTGPGSSTTGHVATFADATGKVLQDGGALIGGANTILSSMLAQSAVALGFNMLNGQVVASVSSNALTLTIETLAGAAPSSSDPVWFIFRSATASSSTPSLIEITSSLSVTIPASSTMGFSNATPGRLWLVAVNNGGTVSLAVINCLAGSASAGFSVTSLSGQGIGNVTAFGGGANSAGVLYGPSSLSSMPYSVLGYATYEAGSTLGTAGTWSAVPSRMDLYRPGVPLPSQPVGNVVATNTGTTATTTGGPTVTNLSASFTLTSSANLVMISASGEMSGNSANIGCTSVVKRGGSTNVTNEAHVALAGATGVTQIAAQAVMIGLDAPFSLSAQTYAVYITTTAGTLSFPESGITASMLLQEIMG